MQKIMKAVRLSLIYIAALLIAGSYPLSAMAETADTPPISQTTTTSPVTTQTAPAAAATDTTAAPASTPSSDTTATTAPSSTPTASAEPTKPKETYTYNTETGHWDSNLWQYNPATGKYERPPELVQATLPSLLAAPGPVLISPNTTDAAGAATQQNAGTVINDTTKNAITNAITSGALSGSATVNSNTIAGNATTGNVSAAATIINNVNSTVTNDSNQKAASFISDVIGDVHGDIMLQPMLLKAMLEAGSQASSQNSTTATTTNQIKNDINLSAASGNAAVTGNTQAGNATTGNANTVANVLNIVNSMVSANRSFVGTINIYGSLDGDILIAPDFIPQMLANNGAADSTTASTAVSSKDTQSIVNNVALAAESGKAVVTDNTKAGSAATGDAKTNVVLFNLSGHEIIASNSLLVFVNVLGKWVGVIIDAPTGATAAAIGRGVVANTVTSPDLVIDATTNTLLTNNINLTSRSGDATVARNTRAGNATTGNATASANIGNIVGTQIGLSDWFGILFINVFGSWNGSFGIDTSAGNRAATAGAAGPSPAGRGAAQPLRVIEFIPHTSRSSRQLTPAVTVVSDSGNGSYAAKDLNARPHIRLASAAPAADTEDSGLTTMLSPAGSRPSSSAPWLAGITFLVGLSLVGASTLADARKRQGRLKP